MKNDNIDRLLRSAAQASEDAAPEMPFGFDTRVVALWSDIRGAATGAGLLKLLRRVAVLSMAVIAVSTIAAIRETNQNREIRESLTNEFAIADSAIQDEFSQ